MPRYKHGIGYLVSNYKAGAPTGPMLTSREYIRALHNLGLPGPVMIITGPREDVDGIRRDFSFAAELHVVHSPYSLPVLVRAISVWPAIRAFYSDNKTVNAYWFPGIVTSLSRSLLKRTAMTMMDSQVRLIETTTHTAGVVEAITKTAKVLLYRTLEARIHRHCLVANYVSAADLSARALADECVLLTRIPFDSALQQVPRDGTELPPRLLIPRPTLSLLLPFLAEFRRLSSCEVVVLLNEDIPQLNQYSNVRHVRFVDRYGDFYEAGGLVVLLDRGGAGTTNRSIVASLYGLPFVATKPALRGHDFIFPNALLVSNSAEQLATHAAQVINRLRTVFPASLDRYLAGFAPEEAVKPLARRLGYVDRAW